MERSHATARGILAGASAIVALLVGSQAFALTITLVPADAQSTIVRASAYEDGPVAQGPQLPVAVPASGVASADSGAARVSVDYQLTSAAFLLEMTHEIDGALGHTANRIDIYFQVDEPTPYQVSGTYVTSDAEGRWSALGVILDVFAGSTLLNNSQFSLVTPNQTLVVGGTAGDESNRMVGSLAGTLLPGTTYHFIAGTAFGMGTTPGSARGVVALHFVPEPASAALVLAGLAALAARRRAR